MIEVSVSQAKASLSEYINRAVYGRERIVIASRGKSKAALISMEDLQRLEALEKALATRQGIESPPSDILPPAVDGFRQGWREAMTDQTIPIDQLWVGIDDK